MNTGWETVIGLETHVQLNTASKLFSGAANAFGAAPNIQTSAVDIGLPGTLPVANLEVFRKAVAFGLAIGATVNRRSVFDRKNYFYPDLPKGYQITQLHHPIVERGSMDIATADGSKTIRITRAHIEEDAGKSLHEDFHGMTGIDLNRAGTPLIEIVTEPDLRSADEAVAYARQIHQLVCYLGISDGDMSQGSFRCDANISIRRHGDEKLGTRTEIKNVNSFRFLERAILFEIRRQIDVIESGGRVTQETRLYDPDKDETRPMRSKETVTDYRYFPEPDLLPVELDETFIEAVRASIPELPTARHQRFMEQYALSAADAEVLTAERALADYFEAVAEHGGDPRLAANWTRVELLGALNRTDLDIRHSPISAARLGGLIRRIQDGTISGRIAKQVFEQMWDSQDDADSIIRREGLRQVSDSSAIEPLVDEIIAAHPAQVEQFRSGKDKVLGFLVGQVMKKSGGKANPQQVNELIRARLGKP